MKITFVRLNYRPRWAIVLVLLATLMIVCGACTASTVPSPSQQPKKDTPVIHYLKAPKQVIPSETMRITCAATTKNESILNYEWSATGGQIQGKGNSVIWTAPSAVGVYTITVDVSSYEGSKATSSATILVTDKPNRPPVIQSVTCLGCKNGTQAAVWKTYSIQCDASDPEGDALSYQWAATAGKIEGNGRFATWQSLGQYAYAVITVKVRDDKGNETEGYLAVNVGCCD